MLEKCFWDTAAQFRANSGLNSQEYSAPVLGLIFLRFVENHERGKQMTERLRVVDWEHPADNDFLLLSQFSVTGALSAASAFSLHPCPRLVVVELKKPACPRAAFDENLTHYKQQIPALYCFNARLIASNGTRTFLQLTDLELRRRFPAEYQPGERHNHWGTGL